MRKKYVTQRSIMRSERVYNTEICVMREKACNTEIYHERESM